ncbi:hypothetical protein TUN199_07894 [Pyrenophora tritici-repentis]|nr:hypothetical protein Alg130_07915 [Pyrenophora tritici-repentis]KAI0607813.1 hypothetical protein TUN205_07929 [Pyrenophora tritici-repentis]KAI0620103.1 hypothetical protein TUN199_07894 [Pyrenophora tritici-repentis]
MPLRNLKRVAEGTRGPRGPYKRVKTAKGSASLPIRTSPRKALVAAAS